MNSSFLDDIAIIAYVFNLGEMIPQIQLILSLTYKNISVVKTF